MNRRRPGVPASRRPGVPASRERRVKTRPTFLYIGMFRQRRGDNDRHLSQVSGQQPGGAPARSGARAAGLRADQRVRVSVEGERVVIERVQDTPLTLEQRLARFNPDRHGGQALVSERVGAERW